MGQSYSAVQEIPYKRPYKKQQVISVHYNPAQPQESYVEQLLYMDIFRCIIGFGFLIVGIITIFLNPKNATVMLLIFIALLLSSKFIINAIWGHPGKIPK